MSRRTSFCIMGLIGLVVAGCAAPLTEAEQQTVCMTERNPYRRAPACSALIAGGTLQPEDLRKALISRADAYNDTGRYDDAIADANRVLTDSPGDLWALMARGTGFKRSSRLDQAIADFDNILRKVLPNVSDPRSRRIAGIALGHRGAAYSMNGDFRRAIPDHQLSQDYAPEHFIGGGYGWLCWDRAALGLLDQALADCEQALKVSPGYPWAMEVKGFVLLRMGRLQEAIAQYDIALSKRPNSADGLYGRGRARQMAGIDLQAATADIAAAIAINPRVREELASRGLPAN